MDGIPHRVHSPPAPFPGHLAAAGVLFVDSAGRVLLVQTHNRGPHALVLPGGVVEYGEAPAAAAEREVAEEIGLDMSVTGLLVMQHKQPREGHPGALMFVFDTDVAAEESRLRLQPEEIADIWWLDPADAVDRHTLHGQARLRAALQAKNQGQTVYLDQSRSLSSGRAPFR